MRISLRSLLLLLFACILCAKAHAANPAQSTAGGALRAELLYEILLGELTAQQGDPGSAYQLMLDAARKSGHEQLYERAVEIALQARAGDSAVQAVRAWQQAHPESREANRYHLQILVGMNRLVELYEPLRRTLAFTEASEFDLRMEALARILARASDKKLASTVLERALAERLNLPQGGGAAWSAVGRLRLEGGDAEGALEALQRAQTLQPTSEAVARLALALVRAGTQAAQRTLEACLALRPSADILMDYARLLLDAKRYPEAKVQIDHLTQAFPAVTNAWLIRGSLELQLGQIAMAEQSLLYYLEASRAPNPTLAGGESERALTHAYFMLARVAQQQADWSKALSWLARISAPEELYAAQIQRASILARQGHLDTARDVLQGLQPKTPEERHLRLNTEVQMLRDARQFTEAYALLSVALAQDPADHDLAYDLAMVAEKLGRFDDMERLLRSVIAGRPEQQHAYNALGYALAERNTRLPEARELIRRALELAPGDPFISDSLGWLEFRAGNLGEAARILEAAYASRPDAEIAAHLGEVLWSMGQRERALKTWREGLGLHPDNETLRETLTRLRAPL